MKSKMTGPEFETMIEQCNMSIQDVAYRLGVCYYSVHKWKNGKAEIPLAVELAMKYLVLEAGKKVVLEKK